MSVQQARTISAPNVGHRRRGTRASIIVPLLFALLAPFSAPTSAVAAEPITGFTIESESGAWVGGSLPQVYTPPEATFTTADEYTATTKEWIFLKIWGVSGTAEGRWFYVNLAAPPGDDLAVGSYSNAVRAVSRGPGEPGIDIYGNGAGCTPHGGFTIQELAFSGTTLTQLAASYEFTCDNNPQRHFGEIRYQSTLGFAGLRQLPNTGYNSIGFQNVFLGESSLPSSITLVNAGSEPITVTDTGWSGEHPGDFALTSSTCTSTLDPGESCAYALTFTPTVAGSRQATFEYTTDTYGVAHGVRLVGTAVAPEKYLDVQPSSIAFGNVVRDQLSPVRDLVVRNFGNYPVTIDSVAIEGDDAFTISSQGCPIGQLASGDSCTVGIRFKPSGAGSYSANVRIVGDQQASPFLIPLTGQGILPPSGVLWGKTYGAGPAYTWNAGNGLARTVSAGSQRLHVAYATDRIGSRWATNSGPRMGIYYVRSTTGSTWTAPKRLNPTTQHAARVATAAAGSRVYVTWVSQTRITSFLNTAPRVLYVRVNTNHGASASWRTTIRLTSTSGRVDYPTIAASGRDVYLAYTDAVTGKVRLAVSRDYGATWTTRTMGTTTASSAQGRQGFPSVAVSGSNAVVSWNADAAGTVLARRSTDRGTTWSAVETVTTDNAGTVSAAVRGTRVAVTWTTGPEIHVRVALAGVWGPDRIVGSIRQDAQFAYSPAVALQGTTRLAVAWAEQLKGSTGWARLNWTESANNGALWYQTQVLGSTTSTSRRVNDWPSVQWPSESTRQVLWGGWTPNTNSYRLYIRSGTGAPVGPAAAAISSTITPSAVPTIETSDGPARMTESSRNRSGVVSRSPDRLASPALPVRPD